MIDPNVCIVCGSKPNLLGIFTPTKSFAAKINQKDGVRLAYGLCLSCSKMPDSVARIEQRFLDSMGACL